MTPAFQLYMAIQSRDTNTALALLATNPAIIHERILGQTQLHYAAATGNSEVLLALLRLGADVTAVVADAPITPLDTAAMYGHVGVFRQLLDAGAQLQQTTPDCGGTLIAAVNGGSAEIVRTLLDLGANPATVFGPYKNNALSQALKMNHHEIATLLKARGCQLPENGQSPVA